MNQIKNHIQKNFHKWKGKEWYHQRFDGAPYVMTYVEESEINNDVDKKEGADFTIHFCFFEKGKADWYILLDDIKKVTNAVLVHKEKDVGQYYINKWKKEDKEFEDFCKELDEMDFTLLSDKKLFFVHKKFSQIYLNKISLSSIIDGFALGSDKLIEQRIKKRYEESDLKNKLRFTEVFSKLTAPLHKSFLRESETNLCRIISLIDDLSVWKELSAEELFEKKIKKYNLNPKIFLNFVKPTFVHKEMIALKNVKSEEELQKHTEEYSFMPMYDVDYKPYDIEFFRKRMNEKIEIPDFNKINLEIANELNKVDEKDKFFFEFFSFMVWFKDERSYYRSKDSFYFRRLYLEISKRLNLTIKELLNMSYEVLYESILSGKRINSNVKGYFAYGKEMDPIFEKDANKIISLFDLNDNFVKGISTEKGNVKGKVVVLLNAKDIDKIKEGDILVSPATRPDFIVAMRKVKAIITDEGGMTSHAAIVSRELGIPCVVGTKYATKIFKDGDLVEIKDDIVRKIIRGHK